MSEQERWQMLLVRIRYIDMLIRKAASIASVSADLFDRIERAMEAAIMELEEWPDETDSAPEQHPQQQTTQD